MSHVDAKTIRCMASDELSAVWRRIGEIVCGMDGEVVLDMHAMRVGKYIYSEAMSRGIELDEDSRLYKFLISTRALEKSFFGDDDGDNDYVATWALVCTMYPGSEGESRLECIRMGLIALYELRLAGADVGNEQLAKDLVSFLDGTKPIADTSE